MKLPALHTVADTDTDLAARLEAGYLLYFPRAPVPLPSADDLAFLRNDLAVRMRLKNISYHPPEDLLTGIGGDKAGQARTQRILREHNVEVQMLLKKLLPDYAREWRVGKVNYRPLEEQGRELSQHASNERIHVDAFPSGATHGARVLRFFTNTNPTESRLWRSAGVFSELYPELAPRAGLHTPNVQEGWTDKLWSSTLKGLTKVGVKSAELADSSPYDRAMKVLHDYMKDSDEFQNDDKRFVDLEFPALSSWAVLTDTVSHACLRGRHALVNTFYIPVTACARPDLAPIRIMSAA